MAESITSTPLPTELATLVSTLSDVGENDHKAVAALAKLGIDTRMYLLPQL